MVVSRLLSRNANFEGYIYVGRNLERKSIDLFRERKRKFNSNAQDILRTSASDRTSSAQIRVSIPSTFNHIVCFLFFFLIFTHHEVYLYISACVHIPELCRTNSVNFEGNVVVMEFCFILLLHFY